MPPLCQDTVHILQHQTIQRHARQALLTRLHQIGVLRGARQARGAGEAL